MNGRTSTVLAACATAATAAMLPAVAAAAQIECYEYMTVGGSGQTAGIYVLTDYVPKSNTVVRAKYASSNASSSGNNQFLFCSRLKASATTDALNFNFCPNVNGKFRFDYYGTQASHASAFLADRDYILEVRAGKAYVTDTVTSSVAELGPGLSSFAPQYKMALFQSYVYSGGAYGSWGNAFHGKFYYLQTYDIENGSEELTHCFVPCFEDGVTKICDLADSDKTYSLVQTGGGTAVCGGSITETIGTGVSSYIVTESGSYTLDAPSANALLVNLAPDCTLDQTADPLSAEYAHAFTGFSPYDGSGTAFKGGYWDFGGGYFPTNAANDRVVTVQDGAIVTNIASMPALNYSRNAFNLRGASRLYITGDAVLDIGGSDQNRSNILCVAEGSALHVGGTVIFGQTQAVTSAHRKVGSSLEVTGEGSYAKMANLTLSAAGQNGAPGDYSVIVSDHGRLDVPGTISLGTGARSFNNRLYVTDGGAVTAGVFNVGAGWQASYDGSLSGYEVHVLRGGSLRANTSFNIGGTDRGVGGMKLIVSNATFSAQSLRPFGYTAQNRCSEVRISGPQAKFDVSEIVVNGFFGVGTNNQFIVENSARLALPMTSFSYTGESIGNMIVLRSGAEVTGSGLKTCNVFDTAGTSNRCVIADGASLTLSEAFGLYGNYCKLEVDDGSLSIGQALRMGQNIKTGDDKRDFTNQVFRIAGSHPSVRVAWNLLCLGEGSSKVVFALPSSGYDEGVGTDENPILQCGRTSGEQGFFLSGNSSIEFENVAEFARSHKEKRSDYVLIDSNSVNISDEKLAAASASFPETMTLEKTEKKLILRVRPKNGTVISFR